MQGVQVQSLVGELRSHMPCSQKHQNIKQKQQFPDGTVDKNLPANAGDTGSTPGPEGSHMHWRS